MKSFKEYLTESKKTYPFKIKIAGDMSSEQEDTLKILLAKYQVVEFKKAGKTPVQSLPLDFPRLTNSEVNIYEVVVDYPVASHELANYLGNGLKILEQRIVVRKPGEPSEEYQEPQEKREGALLNDSEYKESPNVDSNDYYGDKYNASFVKALNDDLKAKRKEQGEVIPTEGKGQTTNDLPQNNQSPVAK
jgi:hypothetical protein